MGDLNLQVNLHVWKTVPFIERWTDENLDQIFAGKASVLSKWGILSFIVCQTNKPMCYIIIHRFTSKSLKLILPPWFQNKPWTNTPVPLSEADASFRDRLAVCGHYWFRLTPPPPPPFVQDYLRRTLYKPLFTRDKTMRREKPGRIHQNRSSSFTLICANLADDGVCRSRLPWWRLTVQDGGDRWCWTETTCWAQIVISGPGYTCSDILLITFWPEVRKINKE